MKKKILIFFLIILSSCENNDEIIIDEGNGISLSFVEGLNDNPVFQLNKNSDGYYEMILNRGTNQTIQRITAKLTRDNKPVVDYSTGAQPKKIEWESNLYWWLRQGDTVANITRTYINQLTGELVYTNLPPLLNWKDVLVPTINPSSYTEESTGLVNTVIAPIGEMIGDTMKITVSYDHTITSKQTGTTFFEILGMKTFRDSTYIIFK